LSKDTLRSENLSLYKEKLEEKINKLVEEETQLKESLAIAEEKAESKLNKHEEAGLIKEKDQRRKNLAINLSEIQKEFDSEQISLHKKLFSNKWVLKGTESLISEFNKKFEKYNLTKLQKKAEFKAKKEATKEIQLKLQTRLPLDVPEPIHIQRMLEEEKCLVCDRVAPKGSDAWIKIKELLNENTISDSELSEEISSIHNFENDFKRLYQNGLGLGHIIKSIDIDITNTFLRKDEIENKRRTIIEEFKKIETELTSLKAQSSMTSTEAANLINEYTVYNEQVIRFGPQIERQQNLIIFEKNELKRINRELSSLVRGEIPKYLQEKREVLNEF
jgi:DNA sulfur modification protein DndD